MKSCHLTFPLCGCPAPAPEVAAPPAPVKVKKKTGPRPTPWIEEYKAGKFVKPKHVEVEDRIMAAAADPMQRAALLRQLDSLAARGNLAEFCQQAWHVIEPSTTLDWNWHHQLMCDVLEGMFRDWLKTRDDQKYIPKVRNACLNVPPGSLKSRVVSVFFPVWCWLHCAGVKMICLSVNEQAALRDARASRDLIKSEWYQNAFQPMWKLKGDQDALSNYGNTGGGERLSKASGSEVVGLRGDLLLCDDLNNPLEAESALERNKVNELWDTNIYNRINDDRHSLRIGVQQRVHAGDWTAHIVKTAGEWSPENPTGWLNVVLPAEYEASRKCVTPWGSDPRTIEGESIHASRLTPEVLQSIRLVQRDKYAGQYQQRPTLAEGGRVKRAWWGFCRLDDDGTGRFEPNGRPRPTGTDDPENPKESYRIKRGLLRDGWDLDWLIISVDPANKKTEDGSNWGILVIGGKANRRFILDDRTRRGDYTEILTVLCELIAQWQPDRLLIEDKAAGPSLMTSLKRMLEDGELRSADGQTIMTVIEAVSPDAGGNKEDRLSAVAPWLESGTTMLLDGAIWLEDFVEELALFPNGTRDDRVDSLSQALAHSMATETMLPSW